MAVGYLGRCDAHLPTVFEWPQVEASHEIPQHAAHPLSFSLNGTKIDIDL